MARKETITKSFLIDTAFEMARTEGIENVTARKLATRANCSTQPIFRLYENMDELLKEIFDRAVAFYAKFYEESDKAINEPFVSLGIAYINFAKEESNLFKMLFLGSNRYDKSLYEILNGERSYVASEMSKAKASGCKDPGDLFTKMWIFIHGAACMTITGDYDLGDADTVKLLLDTYRSFS